MNVNIKNRFNNRYVRYGLVLAAGLFLGWLLFKGSSPKGENAQHVHEETEKQVWTCSMHPQIRMDKPGKCPICAMDLIPLKSSGGDDASIDPNAIQLSVEAVALANVQTTRVSRKNPVKDVRLYGTIQVDERLSQSQTSPVNGRIEKLQVSFTGESVKRGQTIATVYSPELLSAQQELIEAGKLQSSQPLLVEAAREKLRLWRLTDGQISAIEQSGKADPQVEIKSTVNGIVTSKNVNQGDYINQGSVLFEIADLSRVWALFDAYETDLPFLKNGDKVAFTLQAIPGETFSGTVTFIDPMLDPATRTSKVRVETPNGGMRLKPGMYAGATVSAPLKQYNDEIVIPKSAVLWTGKRSIVYIKQAGTDTPAFLLREIDLGPSLGDSYVVLSGLNDGDEIVTNGAFTIDASAQLEGKRSMMNTEAGHPATGHEGHTMTGSEGHSHAQAAAGDEHAMITAQGLCEMCKDRIEKAAKSVKGVSLASWDLSTKQLHLHFDPRQTDADKIAQAVAKAGHDTDKYKADKKVYDALPDCCKYRE
ncbi:efflux RND transporter periplasmic adaptor subunit [Limibacterium fermenti]|mgnify:CR=1 FL=1|jgi:Cu(I)/Ag(I) efflux system membrane fusion protein|uniref:efflux RND transporter periplasmic adaptor subunit n=1 Tax=Limibacterium fermenti TaxID=3229863 RepID=UPI000E8663E6|nr:efflux RND transporter periplasmic adaptor subunit [Porphyromonadaceae bacterium]HCM22561.1 efflux RND transporter periplasmic adaptor subunit [Porphyromonadaceae bacterium]